MSLFICAHGELYSRCKYCSEFEFDSCRCDPENDYYVRSCKIHGVLKEEEDDPVLSQIVNMLRKEKIEY